MAFLKPMNSETAFDIFINESVEQNVHNTPSPDIQVGPTAPELGSSSSKQQDRLHLPQVLPELFSGA